MPETLPALSLVEARVLGALIEKEKTTPDVYPLTLNSLTSACNQKTSRDPVMSLAESEIQSALEELRSRCLVIETFGASGRVLRYAHNFGKVYQIPAASVSLLAVLMLRSAQTVSELRANCDRLQHFADASSVEGYLEELAGRSLAIRLPKQAGSREHRWAHLLCGALPAAEASAPPTVGDGALEALTRRVDDLERELSGLKSWLETVLPAGK